MAGLLVVIIVLNVGAVTSYYPGDFPDSFNLEHITYSSHHHRGLGEALTRVIKGSVLAKGTVNYEKRRLIHNGLCTHIYPDWIVVPESTEDVAAIVQMTNKYNAPISVRSGGHSFTCTSTRQGKDIHSEWL